MGKAYCISTSCPFDDCDRHIDQLQGKTGQYTFCNFDAICERYLYWLLSEVKKDGRYGFKQSL
jgi:hypothetical protein